MTQSWDTIDTSLPELSFSAHSRDRNLCSLKMRPRGVLGTAPQLGAGASSQNPSRTQQAAAAASKSSEKPCRALPVTERCLCHLFCVPHSGAAAVGKERETRGKGMNGSQGNTCSVWRGKSVCFSAQSTTHANTNLP